jgi:regulator of protease activity HflC (stomatin/prohibitin superfamily)
MIRKKTRKKKTLDGIKPVKKLKTEKQRSSTMKPGLIVSLVAGGFGLLLLLGLFFGSYTIVPAGQRAVIYSSVSGVQMTPLGEGFHLKVPYLQTANFISVQVQKTEYDTTAASKDLQNVQTKLAVNFHVTPEVTPKLYQQYGADIVENVIHPAVNETVKAVMAKYPAEELITKREEVKEKIETALSATLAKAEVTVDGVYITNFEFSKDYSAAIEAKQVAQQNVLKADQDLQRIKVEAAQKIAGAEAEARSLSLQRDVITPNLIALRQIEALTKGIEKWDGKLPDTMVGGNTSALLNLKKD